MHKFLKIITFGLYNKMKNKDNDNFFVKATKEGNNINPMYVYLLLVGAIGVMLLFVPVIGMLVDIWYNHTMTINLSDMAVYIGAVAGLFISGGIPAAVAEYSYSKFDIPPIDDEGNDMIEENPRRNSRRRYRNKRMDE